MALAVYPPELNQSWLVSGFRASRVDRRVITQPSRGRAWYRRGSSVSGGLPVSAATMEPISGLARFWRFWEEELVGGTLPFKVRDQQIDNVPLSDQAGNIILDESNKTILIGAYWICRFDQVPEETPVEGGFNLWQLSFQLTVLA